MSVNDPRIRPLALHLERTKQLCINWADGHASAYPLALLRRACPCAGCRAAREEETKNPLRVLSAIANPQDLATATDAELVGHYALRITWKDGHNTGIYDYALLRSLCPCEQCGKPNP